jgi:hypothetical protein
MFCRSPETGSKNPNGAQVDSAIMSFSPLGGRLQRCTRLDPHRCRVKD